MASLPERKTLARLQFGQMALEGALNCCAQLLALPKEKEAEYPQSVVAMYVLYARPFTSNGGIGPISRDLVPSDLRAEHQTALDFRHEVHAHIDVLQGASSRLGNGELLVKAIMIKKGHNCDCGHALFGPRKPGLQRMKILIERVLREIVASRDKALERHSREIAALPDGNYEVDLGTPGDAPVYKPMKHN